MSTVRITGGVSLPGHSTPGAGFEAPFEMLLACHERVERMLDLLLRLQQHLLDKGCDASAREAARDVMRYFDLAAPQHHEDEERHVFPPLLAAADAGVRAVVLRLQQDHRDMTTGWAQARITLQAVLEHAGDALTLDETQTATLTQFAALYLQHLQDENGVVYPAAQASLSADAVLLMSDDMMRRRGVRI